MFTKTSPWRPTLLYHLTWVRVEEDDDGGMMAMDKKYIKWEIILNML